MTVPLPMTGIAQVALPGQADVRRLLRENTSGRILGLLGEPRVSVLEPGLALDRSADPPPGGATSTG